MFTRTKKNEENQTKKKPLLRFSLYVAILLFTFWLLIILSITFFYDSEKTKETIFKESIYSLRDFKMKSWKSFSNMTNPTDKIDDYSKNVNDQSENRLNLIERDEFQPSMKDLFKERDLSIKNIDAIFKNMESPKEIKALHSTSGRDVIYIYHTHSRESFLPYLKDTDKPEEAYHAKANITLVGEMLGRALERRGVGTKVDSTDIVQVMGSRNLDYNSSYNVSGELVSSANNENKKLEFFLDIHRDSLRKDSTTLEINGGDYARLLFVVGTGHEDFERNLTFAEGLHNMLATQYPELSKGILQKDSSQGNGVYNQDISPNSVIVEIGGVDNTVEELYRTTEVLAEVISEYYFHREK